MFLQECLEAVGMDGCNDFEEVWMRLDGFCDVFVFEVIKGYPQNQLSTLGVGG